MKKKIAEALKTKYKSFGLSNEAWDRIASAKEETVTKEEEIADAISGVDTMDLIAKELVKMRDSEIQKRTDLQREHDDYKAKHPEGKKDPDEGADPDPDPAKQTPADFAKAIADAVADAVNPIKEAFETYKAEHSAKEATSVAKETFYSNKWTTKFKEEADDAWERVSELNAAKGNKMTADELSAEATKHFNAAVKRRGTDATQPFEPDPKQKTTFDFSDQAKYLQGEGLIPKEEK